MTDLMCPSLKDRLWHRLRADLMQYVPEIASNQLLMCCLCGRFLRQDQFNHEHIIPQRSLSQDPLAVRENPATPRSVRAGNLLLCQAPLKVDGKIVYHNGCNSWKGKHYDAAIADLTSGKAWKSAATTQVHIIAALCLGYLAVVSEYGYRVTLSSGGLLMREQFFNPFKFHQRVPLTSQMLFGGSDVSRIPLDAPAWARPFTFSFEPEKCFFSARNFAVVLPISDPRVPIAQHLRFAPSRFKLRPDFSTVFH